LKRHGLKITFTRLNHVKLEVDVALGSEVRTLQLGEFIDFWQEMKELLPKATYVHLAYQEQLARQRRQRSRASPSRELVNERRNAQEPGVLEVGAGSVNADKEAVWLISPDVLATYTEDGAVVLNVPKEICYGLNNIASRIWLAMESRPSGITPRGIVGVLEETLEIPRERLASDVSQFLDNLHRMSLVRCERNYVS